MKDLDALLRDTLRDEHWALPVDPGLLDSVDAGARRIRRRRRIVSAVTAAAAVVALIAGIGAVRTQDPAPVATPPGAFPAPGGEPIGDMLATPDSLYVLTTDRVFRLDRVTGRVRATSGKMPVTDGSLLAAGNTIWVRKGAGDSRNRESLTGLDPMNLGPTGRVITGGDVLGSRVEEGWQSTPAALWSTVASRGGDVKLIRRDPNSGAVTRRVSCECEGPALAIDETAGVAWFHETPADGTGRSSLVAIRLSDGKTRGRFRLSETNVYTVPGTAGSLWAVPLAENGSTGRPLRLSPDARSLDARTFSYVPKAGSSTGWDAEPTRLFGTRAWIAAPEQGRLTCVDRSTGAVLKTYPLPSNTFTTEGGEQFPTGDDRAVYLLDEDRIVVHRGPDGCLQR